MVHGGDKMNKALKVIAAAVIILAVVGGILCVYTGVPGYIGLLLASGRSKIDYTEWAHKDSSVPEKSITLEHEGFEMDVPAEMKLKKGEDKDAGSVRYVMDTDGDSRSDFLVQLSTNALAGINMAENGSRGKKVGVDNAYGAMEFMYSLDPKKCNMFSREEVSIYQTTLLMRSGLFIGNEKTVCHFENDTCKGFVTSFIESDDRFMYAVSVYDMKDLNRGTTIYISGNEPSEELAFGIINSLRA